MLDYRSDFTRWAQHSTNFDWTVAVSDQGHPELVHCHIAKPPVPPGSECKDSQTCFRHDFETDGEKCGGSLSECLGHQSRFRTLRQQLEEIGQIDIN